MIKAGYGWRKVEHYEGCMWWEIINKFGFNFLSSSRWILLLYLVTRIHNYCSNHFVCSLLCWMCPSVVLRLSWLVALYSLFFLCYFDYICFHFKGVINSSGDITIWARGESTKSCRTWCVLPPWLREIDKRFVRRQWAFSLLNFFSTPNVNGRHRHPSGPDTKGGL